MMSGTLYDVLCKNMDKNMHKKNFKIFLFFIGNLHIIFLLKLDIDYIYLYIFFCLFFIPTILLCFGNMLYIAGLFFVYSAIWHFALFILYMLVITNYICYGCYIVYIVYILMFIIAFFVRNR